MPYNPLKHHRRSIRLKGYDYSKKGMYFLTINVQNRACLFGEVVNGEMVLSNAGLCADQCWTSIPEHFPNAVCHEHVIMPNHVHGIIELMDKQDDLIAVPNDVLPGCSPKKQHAFQKMIPRSISSIVKGFKIGVTKWFREHDEVFKSNPSRKVWQRNFYDIIIRDERSFKRISNYILNNPKNWGRDRFNRR